jgi:hypothetical protein
MTDQKTAKDEETALLTETERATRAYEDACRLRMWQIGVPALATLACILCLYFCEKCLFGVMLFCVLLCFKDMVLVLVFVVSAALLIIRHPMNTHTMYRVVDAGMVLVRSD